MRKFISLGETFILDVTLISRLGFRCASVHTLNFRCNGYQTLEKQLRKHEIILGKTYYGLLMYIGNNLSDTMNKTFFVFSWSVIASETIICVDKAVNVSFLFCLCIYLLLPVSLPCNCSLTVKHMVMVSSAM